MASSTTPGPWDSTNDLLKKILRVFGGTVPAMDTDNALLAKILNIANAAGGGGQGTNLVTLTYAASVEIDMLASDLQTVTLGGNITFTTANVQAPLGVSIRIVGDGSLRTLAFPAGWTFVGTKPTDIAANKTGVLSITAYGTNDSDVVAAYAVEA